MDDFLEGWEQDYKKKASEIRLFTDAANDLTFGQKKHFAHLFYHARGHFNDFIWLVASSAPTVEYRKIVLDNIADEMGGLDASHVSHEQLFLNFAMALDSKFTEELKSEESYANFLKKFNHGHVLRLLEGDWDQKWSLFSAYELLDNADYDNLYRLVEKMGVPDAARVFFAVHRDGTHFEDTAKLLTDVWERNSESVKNNFEFIATHQLEMWSDLSKAIFAL